MSVLYNNIINKYNIKGRVKLELNVRQAKPSFGRRGDQRASLWLGLLKQSVGAYVIIIVLSKKDDI